MKRLISALLVVALALALLAVPVLAATATATTMTLEKAEGTVKVTNKSGKSVTLRDGIKLYNGYGLSTETKSYAYIGLDDAKVVKLDSVSRATVIQSGKKLEVDLESGNLFFNVTAPLADDESLNIRTSTMVTGIRGTSGWIKIIDWRVSELYLLTGEVTVTSTDPASGKSRQTTVSAGEMATSYTGEAAPDGSGVEIIKRKFNEDEVPGFVAQEIKKDKALQELITEQTDLDVPKIIGEADERLDADEKQKLELQEEIDRLQNELENEKSVDPLYNDDPNTDPIVVPMVSQITLTGAITRDQLQAALDTYTTVTIGNGVDPTSSTIPPGETVTIAPGKTLINTELMYLDGTLINNSATSFYNQYTVMGTGIFINGDTSPGRTVVSANGAAFNGITVTNGVGSTLSFEPNTSLSGNLTVNGGTVSIEGLIYGEIEINGGTVNLDGGMVSTTGGNPAVTVNAGGTFNFNSGVIESGAAAAVQVDALATATYTNGLIMSTSVTPVSGTLVGYNENTLIAQSIDVALSNGNFYTFEHNDLGVLIADMIANAGTHLLTFDVGSASDDIILPSNLTIGADQFIEFIQASDSPKTIYFDSYNIINRGSLTLNGNLDFESNSADNKGIYNYGSLCIGTRDMGSYTSGRMSITLVNNGEIDIGAGGSLLLYLTPETTYEQTIANNGSIWVSDGGVLGFADNCSPTLGGSGIVVDAGGVLELTEGCNVTIAADITVKDGGEMVIYTLDSRYGAFVSSGKLRVEDGGSLQLLIGFLQNGTKSPTCISAATVTDVEIADWPTFSLLDDNFADNVNGQYALVCNDGYDNLTYFYHDSIYEAAAQMRTFSADPEPEYAYYMLHIAPQSTPITLTEPVDVTGGWIEIYLGGNTLSFEGNLEYAIKCSNLDLYNGTIALDSTYSGSFSGIRSSWIVSLDNAELTVTGGSSGIPSGIYIETADGTEFLFAGIRNSSVTVTSASSVEDEKSAAVYIAGSSRSSVSFGDGSTVVVNNAVYVASIVSDNLKNDFSSHDITLGSTDGCDIYADRLLMFSLAEVNPATPVNFVFLCGTLGTKTLPASISSVITSGLLFSTGSTLEDTDYTFSDTTDSKGYYTITPVS